MSTEECPLRKLAASAEKALEHVARNPLLRGLDCEIVTVATDGEMKSRLDAAAARLRQAGLNVSTTLASGDTDEAIGSRVETGGFHLLVMGAYGHSRVRTLFVGSTTTAMVRRCKVPVLMFR